MMKKTILTFTFGLICTLSVAAQTQSASETNDVLAKNNVENQLVGGISVSPQSQTPIIPNLDQIDRPIQIYVRPLLTVYGVKSCMVFRWETIADLKFSFFAQTGISPDRQRMYWGGYYLQDNKQIADYNLQDGMQVNLVIESI